MVKLKKNNIFILISLFASLQVKSAILAQNIHIESDIEKMTDKEVTFVGNLGRWTLPRDVLNKSELYIGKKFVTQFTLEKYVSLIKKYPPQYMGGSGGAGGGR